MLFDHSVGGLHRVGNNKLAYRLAGVARRTLDLLFRKVINTNLYSIRLCVRWCGHGCSPRLMELVSTICETVTGSCWTAWSAGSGPLKMGGLRNLAILVGFLPGDGPPASAQPPVPPRSNMLYHGALERRPLWQGNQLSR